MSVGTSGQVISSYSVMEAPLLQVSSEEERSGGYGTREKESVLLCRGDKTGIVESQDGEFVNIEVSLLSYTKQYLCKPELASLPQVWAYVRGVH